MYTLLCAYSMQQYLVLLFGKCSQGTPSREWIFLKESGLLMTPMMDKITELCFCSTVSPLVALTTPTVTRGYLRRK